MIVLTLLLLLVMQTFSLRFPNLFLLFDLAPSHPRTIPNKLAKYLVIHL